MKSTGCESKDDTNWYEAITNFDHCWQSGGATAERGAATRCQGDVLHPHSHLISNVSGDFCLNFIIRGQLQQFLYKSIRIFLTIRSFCYLLGDDLLCLKCRWYNKSLLPPQLHLHLSVHNYLWSKSSLFLIENRPTTFHQDSDDSLKIGQP